MKVFSIRKNEIPFVIQQWEVLKETNKQFIVQRQINWNYTVNKNKMSNEDYYFFNTLNEAQEFRKYLLQNRIEIKQKVVEFSLMQIEQCKEELSKLNNIQGVK